MDFCDMTYKEFRSFCNKRACDGQWSMLEAMNCIKTITEIDSIKIKALGFIPLKKKTEQAREKAWKEIFSDKKKKEGSIDE